MKGIKHGICLLLVLAMTACGNQPKVQDQSETKSAEHAHELEGSTHIPGYNEDTGRMEGSTAKANNADGNVSKSMGTSVYSLIGSSSLHDGGISAHLQSRLSSAGVEGIDVLVLDDTVILGRAEKKIVATDYDPMQHKVLNGTAGTSATGVAREGRPAEKLPGAQDQATKMNGTKGTSGSANQASSDNLEEARRQISSMFDGHVRILVTENPEAIKAMERFKKEMQASSRSIEKLSADMGLILKNAAE